jgi:galactokinase
MTRLQCEKLLSDRQSLALLLAQKGLSADASHTKAALYQRCQEPFSSTGRQGHLHETKVPDTFVAAALFVPGRIEVLGKHTDYAGGRSMVAAVERGFCAVFAARSDCQINVVDVCTGERAEFLLHAELVPRNGHWSNYPMTVARRVARNFPAARCGVDLAFASDLPPAAGMSSSSALMVAVFLVLAEVNQLAATAEYRENLSTVTALGGYLGTVENGQNFGPLKGDRGVGTFGGSEDHTAILCAEPNAVSQYVYCPVRFERTISIPVGYTFVIAASGVVAEKTGDAQAKYNAASRLVTVLLELWRRETGRDDPHLASALASSPDALARLRWLVAKSQLPEFAPRALSARLEHFVTENIEVIPAAGDALQRRDFATFGELVDRSQRAAEQLLGNQVPETIHLAATARQQGAVAASAFGAGFGGSVWALVRADEAAPFLDRWKAAYRDTFPQHAVSSAFFTTAAGPAAFRLC